MSVRAAGVFAFALLASLSWAGAASAQFNDNRALYEHIQRLERDIQALQAQSARGATGGGSPTVLTSPQAGVTTAPQGYGGDRLAQMEELIRQLTGQLEETNFKVQRLQAELERSKADTDLRLKDLEGGNAASADGEAPANGNVPANDAQPNAPAANSRTLGTISQNDAAKADSAAAKAPANDNPQALYDMAYKAAQGGDYATAEKGFTSFLARFPKHQLAGNSQYWLGDIAYARKDYASAAQIFLTGYKTYGKHSKAPDMIYKAGSSFGMSGKTKEACVAFDILFNDHPKMPDRVKSAANAERKKYKCK